MSRGKTRGVRGATAADGVMYRDVAAMQRKVRAMTRMCKAGNPWGWTRVDDEAVVRHAVALGLDRMWDAMRLETDLKALSDALDWGKKR